MSDVLVAVVSGGLTLIGVAIPIVTSAIQGNEKDKRDHQERAELERQRLQQEEHRLLQERRKESAALLRMARDFHVAVENSYESRGADKTARTWDIRQRAADLSGQADEIGLLVPELNAAAEALAGAAIALVAIVGDERSLPFGAPVQRPDTAELSRQMTAFKLAALDVFHGGATSTHAGEIAALETSLVPGELHGDLTMRG
jgi:hypothetical protein